MLLHDLLLPVVSRCFPSRHVAHRVPNSWCGSAASPCFAFLPWPVSGPPGPRSVLRVRFFPIRCSPLLPGPENNCPGPKSVVRIRCFPIRCFPLLPVASRCLPGRRIIPRIPNPWCGSVASRSAASRCFPLYRHRPFRAVVPAKRNRYSNYGYQQSNSHMSRQGISVCYMWFWKSRMHTVMDDSGANP